MILFRLISELYLKYRSKYEQIRIALKIKLKKNCRILKYFINSPKSIVLYRCVSIKILKNWSNRRILYIL